MTQYSGFTADTPDRLVLDSGAFYKNYNVATGVGTLLGATRGGGEFKAVPEIRAIEVDGVKGRAKGLNSLDSWEVSIVANVLEITPAILADSLATGSIDTSSNADYDIITAGNAIALSHYINNITWVGRLSGSNKPVIIQIFNALNVDGLTLKTEDKGESVIAITFMAHYDYSDLDNVPFKIYYPKISTDITPPTVTVTPADAASGIAVGANVVWLFSEAIIPSLVNTSNFFLIKASDGTLVPGTLSISADRLTVTFDPTANLTAATPYIAFATTNVKDVNGNALAAASITNFTTA